jgi:poly(A) polymerase
VGKPATFTETDRIRFNEHEHVGAEMTEAILERLKFSREQIERVKELVKQHMAFKDVRKMRPATRKRFLRQPHFDEHLALHKLDCTASHGDLTLHEFCEAELTRETPQTLRPAPLLTGSDLIALGMKPGPEFGRILKELEDGQLEGRLTNRGEALAFVASQRTS